MSCPECPHCQKRKQESDRRYYEKVRQREEAEAARIAEYAEARLMRGVLWLLVHGNGLTSKDALAAMGVSDEAFRRMKRLVYPLPPILTGWPGGRTRGWDWNSKPEDGYVIDSVYY